LKISFIAKKLEKTQLFDMKNLQIRLSDPQKVEGSFFFSSYYTYLLTVSELNKQVRRRYSEFVWLRDYLVDMYPGINIPPLPNKKTN